MNDALQALVEAKVNEVNASMVARYGPAFDAYLFHGVYDPVLAEIGVRDDLVYPKGLSGLIDEIPVRRSEVFKTTYPPAAPFWQTIRNKRPGRRK